MGPQPDAELPPWLATSESYHPETDRDDFITRSLLSVSSALALFRLDDGRASCLSPSAPVKLQLMLACILLTSLSRNYLFVLVVLGCALLRTCLLPQRSLLRVVAGSATAAVVTALLMTPAALLGQPQAPLLLGTKALACTGVVLLVAVTTPVGELTGALRAFGIPSLVILTIELALRSIAQLGSTATEVLTALRLRSVGRNRHKRQAMAGVGGVVLVKAARSSQDTLDAMRCRGFDGEYQTSTTWHPGFVDAVWIAGTGALVVLFLYLQRAV